MYSDDSEEKVDPDAVSNGEASGESGSIQSDSEPVSPIKRVDSRRGFVLSALVVEAGLGVVAIGLGAVLGVSPVRTILAKPDSNVGAILWGLAATLPMLASLMVVSRWPPRLLREFREYVYKHIVPLFQHLGLIEMAVIALAAGVGEELLFRGLLQRGLAEWFGDSGGTLYGLLVASAIFGVCHWLNATYAILAGLIGLYLGLLFVATDNLLAPITTHAVYDFVALVYLTRQGDGEGG